MAPFAPPGVVLTKAASAAAVSPKPSPIPTGVTPMTEASKNRLAAYERVGAIGQGTSAVTWKCRSLEAGQAERFFAIKEFKHVLLPDMDGADCRAVLDDFHAQVALIAGLRHPRIPRYVEHFAQTDADGITKLYLVTEYVEGKTIRQLVEGGMRFTETEATDFLLQMLDTIKYLHSFDPPILHRDISPNNLIRGSDDWAWLVDFGIAIAQPHGASRLGTCVGTPCYAPIEQTTEGRASKSADLYALGATAMLMVTGKDPSELTERRKGHPRCGYPSLKDAPGLSRGFVATLETMTAPLEQRFQDADAVRKALNGATAMVPAETYDTSPPGARLLDLSKAVKDARAASKKAAAAEIKREAREVFGLLKPLLCVVRRHEITDLYLRTHNRVDVWLSPSGLLLRIPSQQYSDSGGKVHSAFSIAFDIPNSFAPRLRRGVARSILSFGLLPLTDYLDDRVLLDWIRSNLTIHWHSGTGRQELHLRSVVQELAALADAQLRSKLEEVTCGVPASGAGMPAAQVPVADAAASPSQPLPIASSTGVTEPVPSPADPTDPEAPYRVRFLAQNPEIAANPALLRNLTNIKAYMDWRDQVRLQEAEAQSAAELAVLKS